MKIKAYMRDHPIAAYFVLVYTISWFGTFVAGGVMFLRGETLQFEDGLRIGLLMLAGPTIAGILMTYLVDGKQGLRDLISRMFKWRVNLHWYAAALLIFPVLILAVLLALTALVSPNYAPGFISFGVIAGLFAGFFEEIGWTGYAFPKMRSKYGVLQASLFLALLHGLWHLLAGYLSESQSYGVYWLPRFIAMWIVAMTAMRILLIWIYTNTGSLLLAQLTHASSTGFLFILGRTTISPVGETFWWAIYALTLWVAAAVVIAKYWPGLLEQPGRGEARLPYREAV